MDGRSREPLDVLFALHSLTARTGGQIFIRDVSRELVRRGHFVTAWTQTDGGVADEIEASGVRITHTLADVSHRPSVIYGHSTGETAAAAMHFQTVPTVFHCHGVDEWTTVPPRLRSVRRYLCTGDYTRAELITRFAVPAEQVAVVPNGVALDRFSIRSALPVRPRRCRRAQHLGPSRGHRGHRGGVRPGGHRLEVVGAGFGAETPTPEQALARADIAFGSGRCALEAAAVGCAVVVWHPTGMAGMVTSRSVDRLRAVNFGLACFQEASDAPALRRAVREYDAGDAAWVRDRIRHEQSIGAVVGRLESELRTAIEASATPVSGMAEMAWLSEWIGWLSFDRVQASWRIHERDRGSPRSASIRSCAVRSPLRASSCGWRVGIAAVPCPRSERTPRCASTTLMISRRPCQDVGRPPRSATAAPR